MSRNRLAAALFAGRKGATLFAFLGIGDRFRFTPGPTFTMPGGRPITSAVYTKTSTNGWYKDAAGNKLRTGTSSAVYPTGDAA